MSAYLESLGFTIPPYPLRDEDGELLPKVEHQYPPPYGFEQGDKRTEWHFIYGPRRERMEWMSPAAILLEGYPGPQAVLVEFAMRAWSAERRVEELEGQLLAIRRAAVTATGGGA